MFRVKVCGITTQDDARRCVEAGVGALGLNFYPKSPRCVTIDSVGFDMAAAIARAAPPEVTTVGLFVNADEPTIRRAWEVVGFGLIQLHGDETPEFVAQLAAAGLPPVMRAFRLGPAGLGPVYEFLAECDRLGCRPAAVLLDAHVPGSFGGTGHVADWSTASIYPKNTKKPTMVLAGGLTPDNVATAIHTVHPAAVDTASGVESSPGRKDPALVRAFVDAAMAAFSGENPA
ncbi:MAG: phosphoribosylanthranilate isomerase [Pirellulales bacterium]|nr:phosphoribosylanthranilate isomerase [Pirellulales bacterium]